MNVAYPQGPSEVPRNFTKAKASYRRHAWIAFIGLILFMLFYIALGAWFCYSAYFILYETIVGIREPITGYLAGSSAALLGIFMIKALFFFQHRTDIPHLEVTADDEPALFEFLYRLADETKAPRPHRVFLSNQVNACVFYDLSLLNLFFPTKKNLEIGLPLINGLTLGEFKAVVAHEFGHFAQKSMAVGRWVYMAEQIAGHIIAKRDWFDQFLEYLSKVDIRVAWLGYLLRLIVWSIRSVMHALFSLVLIAQRALTREMEFQADLVAVSVTGSDALVHALYKLDAVDEAWERTFSFVNHELGQGRKVSNLFTVQKETLEKVRYILDDASYGCVPDIPQQAPESHRVFRDQIAHPPKMWATHPENNQRENNAKNVYLSAPLDDNSAWRLFKNADVLQKKVTRQILESAKGKRVDIKESLENLKAFYGARFLNPRYKGAYLGRELTRHADDPKKLYDRNFKINVKELLGKCYTVEFRKELAILRELEEEVDSLQALKAGYLKAEGGIIRHNGVEYQRSELDDLIYQETKKLKSLQAKVRHHDKLVRSAHMMAAEAMGKPWAKYLAGLVAMLHYAEHTLANLHDIRGVLNNVVAVTLADEKITKKEFAKLLETTHEVWKVLARIYAQASQVKLDASLQKRLDTLMWFDVLGDFTLPQPDPEIFDDWMNAVDSWFDGTLYCFSSLRSDCLEQLLTAEAYISAKYKEDKHPDMPYDISEPPKGFHQLLPGQERKHEAKLSLWDRFYTAQGLAGASLRFSAAASIVGGVLLYTLSLVFHFGYFK